MRTRMANLICVCSIGLFGLAGPFARAENHDALKAALETSYGLTKVSWDKVRVTDPGPVYVLKAEGVNADRATDMTMLVNKVVDGHVQQPKGFGASMFSKQTTKQFKAGDRLYLTKIDVKDEGLLFWFISTETSDYSDKGSSKQTRYRAVLSFEVPKALLEASQTDEIKKIIDPIVLLETDAQAANTKTVELGQTPDQVKAALGAPDKIIKLGSKDVYVYKDMKVVFVDGKVSDVQ
jgi:hypothetical protein